MPEELDGQEGVDAASPPAPDTAAQPAAAAVTGSTSDAPAQEIDAEGVPWRNRMAEMERRHQRMLEEQARQFQQQIQATLQAVSAPQARPAPQSQEREYTDDELLALANQGHSVAMQQLIQRQVARQSVQQQRTMTTSGMIAQLQQRYPDLVNAGSALYTHANQLYRALLNGRDSHEAQLMAYTTAIADRPELVTASPTSQQRASEGARRNDVQSHDAMGSTSFAREARPRTEAGQFASKVLPQESVLAKKLGVKDPAAAKKRFIERQAQGRSSVSPGLSSAIGDV